MKRDKFKQDEISKLLVDYIEDDLSEELKKDLDLVIRNSPNRSKSLKALRETRQVVKSSEARQPHLSEDFFDQLHGKIMAEVAHQKPRTKGRLWLESQSWHIYAAAAVVLLVSGSVLFSLLKPTVSLQSAGIERTGSDMLLSISVEVPEVFADSLLNDRESSDFYMDAMADKVAQLEEKSATNLMNEIGEK